MKIKALFGHRLQGNKFMQKMVLQTLEKFPKDIQEFIATHVWFVSSFEDGWAFTLRGDELKKNEYLIFLSDELLKENPGQITWTIAHEIGHVVLGHRNSIGKLQTKKEISEQEKEADRFAKKYLQVVS
ncbi:MAG TPA: ImmA/IrrE family metallo-endopeptidase [Patescibacteria group bacterium]|nr:ImmA/IrrE family metallo-endopeptidase [Patescibacteria group bacterium]